jgi:glycosyltransferase involved in cell wall biosynthesis
MEVDSTLGGCTSERKNRSAGSMKVTVGIKALNEAKNIAATLASALSAVKEFSGEVILADSGSTDSTVEIAQQFAVRIFQLSDHSERCCGAGAQLAFQHSVGDYFYLLDGDMVLNEEFLQRAIGFLDANPEIAGVGGHIVERNLEGEGFEINANMAKKDSHRKPGVVDRLDGGGLYRRSAILDVGYFADRNLHAFEEFDLAARLQSRAWKLARIDLAAVSHYGHTVGAYKLLLRRMRSGYAGGVGEVVRGALGKQHQAFVLRKLGHVRHGMIVLIWWVSLMLAALASPLLFGFFLVAPLLFLTLRRGSLRLGAYSMAAWNVTAFGLLSGFFQSRISPMKPLASADLTPRGQDMEAKTAPSNAPAQFPQL